jgi:predicted nucleotidyltransferase
MPIDVTRLAELSGRITGSGTDDGRMPQRLPTLYPGREVRRLIEPRARKKPLSVPEQIDRMVQRIVKEFHPETIILFGSQARGDAGPDSDLDMLVVLDFQGSKLEKMVELRGVLGKIAMPVDILVTTPDDIAWRKDVVGTIEWPAFREGKVLYARTDEFRPRRLAGVGAKVRERSDGGRPDPEAGLPRAALRRKS